MFEYFSYFKNVPMVGEGVKFPILASRSVLMTRKDILRERSKELKPKIIKLLETRQVVRMSELLKLLDANVFEIMFALNELKKDGKAAFG